MDSLSIPPILVSPHPTILNNSRTITSFICLLTSLDFFCSIKIMAYLRMKPIDLKLMSIHIFKNCYLFCIYFTTRNTIGVITWISYRTSEGFLLYKWLVFNLSLWGPLRDFFCSIGWIIGKCVWYAWASTIE